MFKIAILLALVSLTSSQTLSLHQIRQNNKYLSNLINNIQTRDNVSQYINQFLLVNSNNIELLQDDVTQLRKDYSHIIMDIMADKEPIIEKISSTLETVLEGHKAIGKEIEGLKVIMSSTEDKKVRKQKESGVIERCKLLCLKQKEPEKVIDSIQQKVSCVSQVVKSHLREQKQQIETVKSLVGKFGNPRLTC